MLGEISLDFILDVVENLCFQEPHLVLSDALNLHSLFGPVYFCHLIFFDKNHEQLSPFIP
jgi:hypothetical protein